MVKAGILPSTPADVARFLFANELPDGSKAGDLNRQRVGEYLATHGVNEESQAWHRALLAAYMQHFRFTDASICDALREWLSHFRLPGEAQQIDRLVASFSEAYCRDQTSAARGDTLQPDAAYTLAFAAIMLNTDLHNPRVKRKMTCAEFSRNMHGVHLPASGTLLWD
jgi:Sec7-like guanine-nucleotide exchange factor